MKRTILAVALVTLVAAPAVARAQSTSPQTGQISAKAKVASVVTVARGADLVFGSTALLPGSTQAVDVTTGSGGTRGYATVDHNVPVNVAVSVSQALTETSGAGDPISFTVDCGTATDATLASVSTASWAGCSTTTPLALSSKKKTQSFVAIGGSVTIPAGQAAGDYTGTINIQATFSVY